MCIPKELLDKVDVGHQHSAAAIALAPELVHGITVAGLACCARRGDLILDIVPLLKTHSALLDRDEHGEIALPEITNDLYPPSQSCASTIRRRPIAAYLSTREATDGNNHLEGFVCSGCRVCGGGGAMAVGAVVVGGGSFECLAGFKIVETRLDAKPRWVAA